MTDNKDLQKKLIDACNLLCEHICGKLPSGWEVVITFRSGEPEVTLVNPAGDDVEIATSDYGYSHLDSACDQAIEAENTWQAQLEIARSFYRGRSS